MKKISQGFTLIELMVVIAIIVILSAIVLPNLNSARIKGRDAKRISDLKNIQLALSVYYDAHRSTGYPFDIYEDGVLAPTYIPVVPRDPKGDAYIYSALASGSFCGSYHLAAVVEGTAASGSDDVDAVYIANAACPSSPPDFQGVAIAENCAWGNSTVASPATNDKCYDVKP